MFNPHDGTVAQMVPQTVEKLPLYHWRPGARLLVLGSRDGASFDGDVQKAEAHTFHRRIDGGVIAEAIQKLRVDGVCAAWSASLLFPESLEVLIKTPARALVMATPAIGDEALLEPLLPRVDAWLLLIEAISGPLARRVLELGRHVEVAVGLSGDDRLPALPWERAKAIHLFSRRVAVDAQTEQGWLGHARKQLPSRVPIYDPTTTHTDCSVCKQRLVWRSGGRSRLEHLKPGGIACVACGAPASFTW